MQNKPKQVDYDLAQSLADALEDLIKVADDEFGLRDHEQDYDKQTVSLNQARAALANYRKGE